MTSYFRLSSNLDTTVFLRYNVILLLLTWSRSGAGEGIWSKKFHNITTQPGLWIWIRWISLNEYFDLNARKRERKKNLFKSHVKSSSFIYSLILFTKTKDWEVKSYLTGIECLSSAMPCFPTQRCRCMTHGHVYNVWRYPLLLL